ncbi:SRPBCC family protein [Tengunoibacter tsumagoiensis]|uniref:Polyketide cyclase n=1 Tax=Tengunoibacter tsumagoiensis TaxID=2014871 RepID=A0A402A3V1_9CHLR|nr:SRPBCC family protein [Tengunoibacter tsumagoiensis]GCE13705.1 polyketide cyclase [Tengunoibacter tsumagoiensis]
MSRVFVKRDRIVHASPNEVYSILADYKNKRPLMLTPNFQAYMVEKGGKGAGTVVRYTLHAANRVRPYRLTIEEAVPGKVLRERDSNSSLVTTWTVAPKQDGQQTLVRIATEWEGSKGIGGFFERTFAPLGLSRIYDTMLDLLGRIVSAQESERSSNVEEDSTPSERAGVFFLILGIVLAVAFGLSYLQKQSRR